MSFRTTLLFAFAAVFAVACAPDDQAVTAPSVDASVPVDATDEAAEPGLVMDFGASGEVSWFAQNDTVMGGVSEGTVDYTDGSLTFEGTVSTDNNGGFASVRSPAGSWDLSDLDTVVVRLRSAGQPFTLVMADTPYWWEGEFRHDLDATDGEWVELEIPLTDFEFHAFSSGYPEPTGERMRRPDRKDIVSMQFMSALFEDGDFELEVDHLTFW